MKILPLQTDVTQGRFRQGLVLLNNQLYFVVGQRAGLNKTTDYLIFSLTNAGILMRKSSVLGVSDEIISDHTESTIKQEFLDWSSKQLGHEVRNLKYAIKIIRQVINEKLNRKFKGKYKLSNRYPLVLLLSYNNPIVL